MSHHRKNWPGAGDGNVPSWKNLTEGWGDGNVRRREIAAEWQVTGILVMIAQDFWVDMDLAGLHILRHIHIHSER